MTCPPAPPTFRLLDAYVGWDEHDVCRLTGLEDPHGIHLAFADGIPVRPEDEDEAAHVGGPYALRDVQRPALGD